MHGTKYIASVNVTDDAFSVRVDGLKNKIKIL